MPPLTVSPKKHVSNERENNSERISDFAQQPLELFPSCDVNKFSFSFDILSRLDRLLCFLLNVVAEKRTLERNLERGKVLSENDF